MRKACLSLVCSLTLIGLSCQDSPPTPPPAKVRINGTTWTVELAMTEAARYQGLSGRRELAPGRGMLFVYPQEKPLSFCMRGCEIPIDIAFLDRNLRVVNLYEMQIEPDRVGRTAYRSYVPVQFALEVGGGSLKQAGVRVGQQAEFINVPPADQAEPGD
ncbi:hypothetical protein GF348_05855 [candidate division KSB3 bacterium]|nr:hypothetical protein [candidate division KSB3 bacterium]